MLQSVMQAYNLANCWAVVIQVYTIAVEIGHNSFNPGVLCTLKCLKLFTHVNNLFVSSKFWLFS